MAFQLAAMYLLPTAVRREHKNWSKHIRYFSKTFPVSSYLKLWYILTRRGFPFIQQSSINLFSINLLFPLERFDKTFASVASSQKFHSSAIHHRKNHGALIIFILLVASYILFHSCYARRGIELPTLFYSLPKSSRQSCISSLEIT